jgi:hypothetical protein
VKFRKCLVGIVIILASITIANGTHLRGAEITSRTVGCSYTYEITLTIYVNFNNTSLIAGGVDSKLSFGDGISAPVPELTNMEIVDAQKKIGRVTFKVLHTYPGAGYYIISFQEPNRNAGILNFDNSVATIFYTESAVLVELDICNTSPQALVVPVDDACKGATFHHNPGAVDLDGDSLSYELVAPLKGVNTPVTNYQSPIAPKFYTTAYNQSNEEKDGPPQLFINAEGTTTWDAPGAIGEYGIAIKIKEWRFNPKDSTWRELGYVIRDMQIFVQDCPNRKPDLQVVSEICVIAGETIDLTVVGSDPDFDPVSFEAFSILLNLPSTPAEVFPVNKTLQNTSPPNIATMHFRWVTNCHNVGSYSVVFKITDHPTSAPRLINFRTVNIKVIAPAPQFEMVTINPLTKTVKLEWEKYGCDNVEEFQVWRRISDINYVQPICGNGMQKSLRYQLLTTLSATESSYTDGDLAIGAQYCYRIVALVGANKTPSRLSLDTCFIPKPVEAPVITNVSVDKTHEANGIVFLRWTSPFEIDADQYPPPYKYNVLEGKQVGSSIEFTSLTASLVTDTVFSTSASNTHQKLFYKVVLYVPTLSAEPLDTSSIASTVFLQTKPAPNAVELTWDAKTPWYNYTSAEHLVYRATSIDGNFSLIESVDVNENDFYYLDNDPSLVKDAIYFYKVMTHGSYGNPDLPQPIENFSQISGAEMQDLEPPCKPALLVANDCLTSPCNAESFHNTLSWSPPIVGCPQDIVQYELVVQNNGNEHFVSFGTVASPFVHDNLKSLAKCYRLIAIDDAGNKSDSSDVVCSDNCPAFRLTNILTRGEIDERNDYFTLYEDVEANECSRFVKNVKIKIFDRWGRLIHSTMIADDASFIFWDGETDSGQDASAGIYYYTAQVTFDVRDSNKAQRHYKGWVHLVR